MTETTTTAASISSLVSSVNSLTASVTSSLADLRSAANTAISTIDSRFATERGTIYTDLGIVNVYIDMGSGNDSNSGLSDTAAWRTLANLVQFESRIPFVLYVHIWNAGREVVLDTPVKLRAARRLNLFFAHPTDRTRDPSQVRFAPITVRDSSGVNVGTGYGRWQLDAPEIMISSRVTARPLVLDTLGPSGTGDSSYWQGSRAAFSSLMANKLGRCTVDIRGFAISGGNRSRVFGRAKLPGGADEEITESRVIHETSLTFTPVAGTDAAFADGWVRSSEVGVSGWR